MKILVHNSYIRVTILLQNLIKPNVKGLGFVMLSMFRHVGVPGTIYRPLNSPHLKIFNDLLTTHVGIPQRDEIISELAFLQFHKLFLQFFALSK